MATTFDVKFKTPTCTLSGPVTTDTETQAIELAGQGWGCADQEGEWTTTPVQQETPA